MIDAAGDLAVRRERPQPKQVQTIVNPDLVVILWGHEGEGKHTLLLEVGLVDARKRSRDDRLGAKEPRTHRRMLAARSFAVVPIAHRYPTHALRLVGTREVRDGHVLLARDRADRRTRLVRERVVRAQEHVVADGVDVPPKAKPRTRRRNVVRRALALGLEQHHQPLVVLAVPGRKRLQKLQPLALRIDDRLEPAAVLRGFDEPR